MDRRAALRVGTVLSFPGMDCVVEGVVGRGSNAIVYQASYRDATTVHQRHRVLVKELFPYDPAGHVWRDENLCVRHDEKGEALWKLHLTSFQRGNDIHLRLLSQWPVEIGGNLNTFALNDTWYTLLNDTGSRSLESALGGKPADSLRWAESPPTACAGRRCGHCVCWTAWRSFTPRAACTWTLAWTTCS